MAMLLVAGCFRGKLPALEFYRLGSPAVADDAVPDTGKRSLPPGAVDIATYFTPGIYGGRQIAYFVADAGYGTYPSREWAVPLSDELGELTQTILAHTPITSALALFDPPSRRHFSYVWRGRVRQFEEVDRGHSVFVAVALDVRLARITDDSVVWSGAQSAERAVPNPTMANIVAALTDVAADVLTRLALDARAALAGLPATRAASPTHPSR
jgi:uncharacterized lipoprotein YmbA